MDFQNLECWQRSSRLCSAIYLNTKNLKDWGFRDQLTRAALSVPSNIAEGMTRSSNKEKLRFLEISRSSIAEMLTQIYIGIEIDYLSREIAIGWIDEAKQLAAMISGLMMKINTSN